MKELFQDKLLKNEKILWSGQPDPSILFSRLDLYLVPFSLLWGGFALFWESNVITSVSHSTQGDSAFMTLFGIPFVLIGLYFIFGRFIYKYFKKQQTYYAVTNKRILILNKLMGENLEATYINLIPAMSKFATSANTGSIIFGNANYRVAMYSNTGLDFFASMYGSGTPSFYDIKDVEQVYKLVSDLRNT